MHLQIVNFNLRDMPEAQFHQVCEHVAPDFAAVPGLVAKIWLADPETNTYGGVYLWRDRAAMLAYQQSELFGAVAANPNFENVSSRDFDVLEGPTAVTRGLIAAGV